MTDDDEDDDEKEEMGKPNSYCLSVFAHFCFRAVLGVRPD